MQERDQVVTDAKRPQTQWTGTVTEVTQLASEFAHVAPRTMIACAGALERYVTGLVELSTDLASEQFRLYGQFHETTVGALRDAGSHGVRVLGFWPDAIAQWARWSYRAFAESVESAQRTLPMMERNVAAATQAIEGLVASVEGVGEALGEAITRSATIRPRPERLARRTVA